jgi:tetratricopeptide (TPR) repeat protein
MTEIDLARSVDYFQKAIALDPDFALGWTGLAQAYSIQAGYAWAPVAEGYERARDAAQRALALAPDLPEGHVRLGQVLESRDWNWKAANDEYQRAFSLAPGNADVLRAVAGMTRIFVGPDAGIELLRQAAALDPLSSSAHRMLGLRCFLAGRLDEATAALKTSLDLNPKAGLVHCFLCATNLAQGRPTEALELAEREVLPDFRLLGIALAQHALGRKEASDAAMAQLIEHHGNTAAYQIAEACAWRGERDRVFEWLERAYTQRDPGLSMTSSDPFFRPVHDDPRWLPFLKKMGFPSR